MNTYKSNKKHFSTICKTLVALIFLNFLPDCKSECDLIGDGSAKEKELLNILKPLNGKVFHVKDVINSTKYSYEISICGRIEDQKPGVGAVQYIEDGKKDTHVLGRYDNTTIMGGTGWLLITYHSGDRYGTHCNQTDRLARIMIICNADVLYGDMQIVEEKRYTGYDDCYYLFEVGSNVSCSIPSKPPSHGLSSGSVFCILFFISISVYLICGFLYKRIVIGAQGMEQIPNYTFWRDFGNLQADGCDYICRWGSRQESHAYRGIDEHLTEEERDDQLLNM